MSDTRATILICPSCRTRLRIAAELIGVSSECPECGVAIDLSLNPSTGANSHQSAATSKTKKSPSLSRRAHSIRTLVRDHRRWVLAAGLLLLIGIAALTSWLPRTRTDQTTVSNSTDSTPSQSAETDRDESITRTTEDKTPAPATPVPIVTIPTPMPRPMNSRKPDETPESANNAGVTTTQNKVGSATAPNPTGVEIVSQAALPPVAEPRRPVIPDTAVVPASAPQVNAPMEPAPVNPEPPLPKPDRKELLAQVLKQSISSLQVPPKTTVRQLARDLNELSNGLLEFDESIPPTIWNKTLSLSLKKVSMQQILEEFAKAADLKIRFADDAIKFEF